jgi:hypothetical protein
MGKWKKLRDKILLGDSDANVDSAIFAICCGVGVFGTNQPGYHIFSRNGLEEIINIQPKGRMTKSYQVAQVRDMILRYRIGEQFND